jgi:hypothetical protein
MIKALSLKKGKTVTATKIVESPDTAMTLDRKVTGTLPPAPPSDVPILIVMETPVPVPPANGETAAATLGSAKLPKTASELPLFGFLGLLCVSASLGVKILRTVLGY